VSKGQEQIDMPNLVSLPRSTAEDTLKQAGFKLENVTFVEETDDQAEVGQVIKQSPEANAKVYPTKDKVTVTVSKGKGYVKMPDVRNKSTEAAQVELYKEGLLIGEIKKEPTYTTDKEGIVLSTHPYDPGMSVQRGVSVPLTVSNGQYPADAKFPNIPVYVEVVPGEEVEIKIEVTDARGNNKVEYQEKITESKEYGVPLVLSPQQDGKVVATVKRPNDTQFNEYQTIPVAYSSLP